MSIELSVSYHSGTGKLTLRERRKGETTWNDCEGVLWNNDDKVAFYRAVALKLGTLSAQGHIVTYTDHSQ